MENTTVLERKTLVWKIVKDAIFVSSEKGELLLNETVKAVWELVDGTRTIEEIVNELVKIHGGEMSVKEIADVVNETITMMMEYEIVKVRQADEFDGWICYE